MTDPERAAEKFIIDERNAKRRAEFMATMQKDWDARPKKAITSGKDHMKDYKGVKGKAQKVIDWSMANMMGAQRFFDWLDGGKEYQGAWVKFMADEYNKAHDAELIQRFRRMARLELEINRLGIKPADLKAERVIDINGGMKFQLDELLQIYAAMKNKKAKEAVLYGNFYFAENREQAERYAAECVKALSQNEKDLADFVIQEYEENFDRINEALIRTYNQGMEHEENYTPMLRTLVETKREKVFEADPAQMLTGKSGEGFRSIDTGFTKKRKKIKPKNQQGIQLGLISTWHTQMAVQEHAAAFGELIRDMRSVLFAKGKDDTATVYQMLRATRGNAAAKMLQRYVNIAATSDTLNAYDALEGISKTLARNMSIAYLCGNFGTVCKQFPSFIRVLPYAGAESTLKALYDALQHPWTFFDEVSKLDPQLKNRKMDAFIQELIRGEGTKADQLYGKGLEYASYLIGAMDRFASSIVFKAVYDANIKKGLSHDDSVRQAQRVVLLTQPTIDVKDKPLLWQQKGYVRLMMMFTTDLAQTFGETVYDLSQSIKHGRAKESFYRVCALTLAAGLIQAMTGGLPDDPIASAFTKQTINSIPLIGKDAVNLWDNPNGNFLQKTSPYIAPFAKIMSGIYRLKDGKDDNDEQALFSLMEGAALLAPFPATGLKRIWQAGKAYGQEGVTSSMARLIGVQQQRKKKKKRLVY